MPVSVILGRSIIWHTTLWSHAHTCLAALSHGDLPKMFTLQLHRILPLNPLPTVLLSSLTCLSLCIPQSITICMPHFPLCGSIHADQLLYHHFACEIHRNHAFYKLNKVGSNFQYYLCTYYACYTHQSAWETFCLCGNHSKVKGIVRSFTIRHVHGEVSDPD